MTLYPRSALARVGLVVLMLLVAGMACSLGGGDGDKDSESVPTVAASVTPPQTRTGVPTFTPFPTLTPSRQFQPPPTATRLALQPTAVFTSFPTWTPNPATTYPYDVRISYPVDGSQVAGYITVVGSASHPRFLQYALEWGPHPNPTNLWYPLTGGQTRPVINGALGAWNTTLVSDGQYQIRVHVWLTDGTETFALVSGIRVSNSAPTAVPTLTPTPRPNRAPQIDPILAQSVDAGQTKQIDVTTRDPDGDTVNLFISSGNPSVARAQIVSASRISVTGMTAGSATITVTANDNRGGLASTAFIVTVLGQNRAPTVNPILAQTVGVGEALPLTVQASDPDGDALTLSALSSDTNIATANAEGTNKVVVTGVSAGLATITLTAKDGRGGEVNTAFQVTVGSQNQPPIIETIFPQTLGVGDVVPVQFAASDPDGDQLQVSASSDTESVVTATVTGPNIITLEGKSAGPATVTLTVSDNINDPVVATFSVEVLEGNQPPTVDQIGPQTMSVGETRDINYVATDPDDDPLQAMVSSDNEIVVTATLPGLDVIALTASSAGTATITLTVSDGVNDAVETTFTVSVTAANQPPVIEAMPGPQTLGIGASVVVNYTVTDPDGDQLQESASSDNPNVVTAQVSQPGAIAVTATGAGVANVTLTVTDGINQPVLASFAVTVQQGNQPPTVEVVSPPQALTVGDAVNVDFTATDPDDDQLQASASSDNPNVVTAQVSQPGVIALTATGPGTATVSLTVTDNVTTPAMTSFTVTVQQGNQAPMIDFVPSAQTLTVGASVNVDYGVSDPDGDQLQASTSSDNPNVATAQVSQPGVIGLTAVGAGTANITLMVTDNINAPVSASFTVSVEAGNTNPTIQPIGDQTVDVNASISVPVTVADADAGDLLSLIVASDNPGVATAVANGITGVVVTGVVPGTATVTVEVDDTRGGMASTSFLVTVTGVNNPPVIEPVADQALNVGEEISLQLVISDADSDPVVLTAISSDPGIATAEAVGGNSLLLRGVAEGVASVELTADDARGGVTTATFSITVSSAGPVFNLMDYPIVPDIPGPMAQSLMQLYQSGKSNFGNQDGAFAKIGDDPMDSPNFLVPFASPGYDVGGRDAIQSVIDFVVSVPVRAADPTINSFNVDSVAAGAGYGIDSLPAPAPGGPPCDAVGGGTNLSCEMQLTRPTIALVSFSAPNVTYMSPDQFRAELQSLVSSLMSEYGVIPVLATIPAGNGFTTEQLNDYNRVIVEVATQSNVTGIPLWNLWRAMQERGVGDPNSVAPQGAGNLTDPALAFGYNVRNLTALQTLNRVWQAVGAK